MKCCGRPTNSGPSSGVDVVCDVPCRPLEGRDWKVILDGLSGYIIFIDEENRFINTEEFAAAVKGSDNYFVLITRENLYNLPYSVEEIYGPACFRKVPEQQEGISGDVPDIYRCGGISGETGETDHGRF